MRKCQSNEIISLRSNPRLVLGYQRVDKPQRKKCLQGTIGAKVCIPSLNLNSAVIYIGTRYREAKSGAEARQCYLKVEW